MNEKTPPPSEEKTMYTSIFERVHKEEGRMEGRAEVARNMLGDGLSVDKVTQYTRLPREKVEKLLNQSLEIQKARRR
ncbi:MAG: hypothetical protein LBR71_07780 [Synergistaceae bacterium]|jgi:predicted transposase YdaD|nr:hypothetical protein [Synergistaceae bacterium]